MENFYMILPSNVTSKDYFPGNTIANFTTKVPQRISLQGEWEVGLSEISYTYSWLNVTDEAPFRLMYLDDTNKTLKEEEGVLEKGQYSTLEILCNAVNKSIKKLNIGLGVTYPSLIPTGYSFYIQNGRDAKGRLIFLFLGSALSNMLSIDRDQLGENAEAYFNTLTATPNLAIPQALDTIYPKSLPDLQRGIHSIFVYCDVIKPTFVGNSFSQILRVTEIPNHAKPGQQINIKYPTAFYFSVLPAEFETVEIHLKDDAGQDINFEYGRVIVTLHFRKKLISTS